MENEPTFIDLDWASDANGAEDDARQTAAKHSLQFEVVSKEGPGGGWPVYRFTGLRHDVMDMLLEYTDGDTHEALDLASYIGM